MKQLRAVVRPQLAKLEQDKATRAKAVHAKYDQLLAQAQTQLTQHQRFDDALLVKNKRAEIASAWLGGNPTAIATEATPGQEKPTASVEKLKPPVEDTTVTVTDRNLFTNGNFEQGMDGWTPNSWAKKGQATVDRTELHNGKPSLRIESSEGDNTYATQKITVKPNTRYRLSGYIKTKDVEALKRGGKEGASLSVAGGFQNTPPLVKSKPWTRVTMDYITGKESQIEVGPRLGHYSGATTGTAWFAELTLTELGRNAGK